MTSFSTAEQEDLRVWAEQNGTSFEDAVARFAGQNEFSSFVSSLEAKNPETFLHAEWVSWAPAHGVIHIVGEASDELNEAVERLPGDVRIKDGYIQTSAEFAADLEAAYRGFVAEFDEQAVSAFGDPVSGTVRVVLPATLQSEARESIDDLVNRSDRDIAIEVAFIDESLLGHGPESSLGGRGWGVCTAGFSVRRGTIYGLTTANHCTSVGLTTSYQGTAMSAPASPVALSQNSGDVKWRRTVSLVTEPRFQAVNNGYRLVTATLNPAVGTAVCKYGISTAQTCGTVASTSVCSSGYCGLTRVGTYISQPGDSGGPWFFGNTAMGIHHGSVQPGTGLVSAFTRIGAVNLLNTVVLTG